MRPEFPSTIDSSMLRTFRECPRKFELEYLHHWKPQNLSVHLHAGKAFASALEETRRCFYEQSLSAEESLSKGLQCLMREYGDFECPPTSAKSLTRMLGALEYYFQAFPLQSDPLQPYEWSPGKRGIEFTFATPLPFTHPVTGHPLIYTGRADMVGKMGAGLYIEDDKTASSLGTSWTTQWDLRSQFTSYAWACREAGIQISGIIVRGISILKTKYDHAQVITYRQDWMIDRWLKQTLKDLSRMEAMWQSGEFDYNLDEACNGFSGCMFRRVCLSANPDTWLEADFARRRWDPLTHQEIPL